MLVKRWRLLKPHSSECLWETFLNHYNDVIMDAIASQITSLTIVYSTVYSDADQRKHQSCASLAFVRGIHRGPVNSLHKWQVTRKMFPFDDVIMFVLVSVKSMPRTSLNMNHRTGKLCWKQYLCTGFLWPRYDDVMKWKHIPRYWPFVRGIHRSLVDSPHKGRWRGTSLFSLICAWTSGRLNTRDAVHLRRHRAHYGVIVM